MCDHESAVQPIHAQRVAAPLAALASFDPRTSGNTTRRVDVSGALSQLRAVMKPPVPRSEPEPAVLLAPSSSTTISSVSLDIQSPATDLDSVRRQLAAAEKQAGVEARRSLLLQAELEEVVQSLRELQEARSAEALEGAEALRQGVEKAEALTMELHEARVESDKLRSMLEHQTTLAQREFDGRVAAEQRAEVAERRSAQLLAEKSDLEVEGRLQVRLSTSRPHSRMASPLAQPRLNSRRLAPILAYRFTQYRGCCAGGEGHRPAALAGPVESGRGILSGVRGREGGAGFPATAAGTWLSDNSTHLASRVVMRAEYGL